MATLTNERGHIGASTISLQRRLDGMAALGGDLDAVHRDELTALVAQGRTYLALAQSQGAVASVAASLMKLGVTELLFDVAVLRTELAGADAMLVNDASLGVLAAPAGRIAGGTTQVQRNIIGERILGLPERAQAIAICQYRRNRSVMRVLTEASGEVDEAERLVAVGDAGVAQGGAPVAADAGLRLLHAVVGDEEERRAVPRAGTLDAVEDVARGGRRCRGSTPSRSRSAGRPRGTRRRSSVKLHHVNFGRGQSLPRYSPDHTPRNCCTVV